jgi:hypothetical protein
MAAISMKLNHNVATRQRLNSLMNKLVVIILPVLAGLGYLVVSWSKGGIGFPLDDAWIHQTYARNLVLFGQWVFNPGFPSAGSTSPLWTLLLTPASFLPLKPYLWTFILSLMTFICLTWVGIRLADCLDAIPSKINWMLMLLLTLEYHLVWASVSGMETLLGSIFILGTFFSLAQEKKSYWLTGLLAGCAIWVRPDLVTLLGPALLMVCVERSWKRRGVGALTLLGIFILVMLPYLWLNQTLSGSILPNTYFAKQLEYQSLLDTPFGVRLINVFTPGLTGVGVLLIPGFVFSLIDGIRKKNWLLVGVYLWWMGFHIIYAIRLPVVYQHGRYLIPAMPVYFILGLLGTWNVLRRIKSPSWKFRSEFFAASVFAVVLVGFYLLGGNAYGNDVSIINSEMVKPAQWVAENIPAGSLVAAHDIGALGYFGNHPIVDLAGLISPEVIPIIRNEPELANLMTAKHVSYLMTFPGWYETLGLGQAMIYQSKSELTRKLGGENMAIYQWVSP